MEMYWNEDPNERPESFSQIKKILIQIHESRRSKKNESIIDTFLSQVFNLTSHDLKYSLKTFSSLLETYAQNTEILVRQKTMMLQEEKQRVNYLLSLFLPESQV